jgi:opacity protein-like surface antigen
MRRIVVPCVVAVALSAATAAAAVQSEHVRVRPAAGTPATTFTVSFRAPQPTGAFGSLQRHYIVSGSTATVRRGCLASFALRAADVAAGARVRVALSPARLGGELCAGTYRGRVTEEATPVCRADVACPQFIVLVGVVGRFSFAVEAAPSGAGDTTAPTFAGLQSAFACTPGAQRPGETTPFTLTWQPAHDDRTPSSQIVYDVYLATSPGGEDYASPTWTTAPGATTFRTPGLASHASFYFVVRARDAAGNEDRNTAERRGIDPCY